MIKRINDWWNKLQPVTRGALFAALYMVVTTAFIFIATALMRYVENLGK